MEYLGAVKPENFLISQTSNNSVRFEVSTAVTMMIIIFWEMIIINNSVICGFCELLSDVQKENRQ
jgi:hypothetical protein